MKDRELIGQLVVLKHDIARGDGMTFPKGMTMRVYQMWRGTAMLESVVPTRARGRERHLRHVGKRSFELVAGPASRVPVEPIPPPPTKRKKPGRRELLRVIERIQTLAGDAKNVYVDESGNSGSMVEPLDEIFNLCVKARERD